MLAYQAEFTNEQGPAFASPLYHVSKNTDFSFYHYKAEYSSKIKNPTELQVLDPRFAFSYPNEIDEFASDAKLFRGCVKLTQTNSRDLSE